MQKAQFENTQNITTNVYAYNTGNAYYIVANIVNSNGTQTKKDFTIDSTNLSDDTLNKIISNTGTKAYYQDVSNSTLKTDAEDIKKLQIEYEVNQKIGTTEVSKGGSIIENTASDNYLLSLALDNPVTNYIKSVTGLSGETPSAEVQVKQSAIKTVNNLPGITVAQQTNIVNGTTVNPYEHINKLGSGVGKLEETIGGSDLSVFLLMEVSAFEDIINEVPEEAQKKELLFLEMDNVLSISYSTLRERFPVRVLGESNPRAHTSSIRTISGHIAFTIFVEDVLARLRGRLASQIAQINQNFDNYKAYSSSSKLNTTEKYKEFAKYESLANNAFLKQSSIQLLDSLPPFHLLIMGVNEQGVFSKMIIKNVSIIDENQYQGTQQPNIVNKVTFVANDIVPLAKVNYTTQTVVTSVDSTTESFYKGTYNSTTKYNREITGTSILNSVYKDLESAEKE